METTFALPAKPIPAFQFTNDPQRPVDTKVPVVRQLDQSSPLPSERPFIAQVVTARLAGTAFPETPGEIVPEERTLKPYNVPMLPSDRRNDSSFDEAETTKLGNTIISDDSGLRIQTDIGAGPAMETDPVLSEPPLSGASPEIGTEPDKAATSNS